MYSQAVTHPSTNMAQCCLTSVIRRELVFSTWYGPIQQLESQLNLWVLIFYKLVWEKKNRAPWIPRRSPIQVAKLYFKAERFAQVIFLGSKCKHPRWHLVKQSENVELRWSSTYGRWNQRGVSCYRQIWHVWQSVDCHSGELAQMVERSLSMWEVGGSIPPFSKTFESILIFLIPLYNYQNRWISATLAYFH